MGNHIQKFNQFNESKKVQKTSKTTKDFMKSGQDLSKKDGSLTQQLEKFISKIGQLNYSEMKSQFLEIVENSPMSKAKRMSIKNNTNKKKNQTSLMMYITNIYLAGSQLSTKLD